MIIKEIAEMLNGMEYNDCIPDADIAYMKENCVVTVVGASDDMLEFYGAIDDEASCYGGGTVYFNRSGVLRSECDAEDCPYFENIQAKASVIKAIWDSKGYLWSYETDIPHKTFEQFSYGRIYSQGIVFSIGSVAVMS